MTVSFAVFACEFAIPAAADVLVTASPRAGFVILGVLAVFVAVIVVVDMAAICLRFMRRSRQGGRGWFGSDGTRTVAARLSHHGQQTWIVGSLSAHPDHASAAYRLLAEALEQRAAIPGALVTYPRDNRLRAHFTSKYGFRPDTKFPDVLVADPVSSFDRPTRPTPEPRGTQ